MSCIKNIYCHPWHALSSVEIHNNMLSDKFYQGFNNIFQNLTIFKIKLMHSLQTKILEHLYMSFIALNKLDLLKSFMYSIAFQIYFLGNRFIWILSLLQGKTSDIWSWGTLKKPWNSQNSSVLTSWNNLADSQWLCMVLIKVDMQKDRFFMCVRLEYESH